MDPIAELMEGTYRLYICMFYSYVNSETDGDHWFLFYENIFVQ